MLIVTIWPVFARRCSGYLEDLGNMERARRLLLAHCYLDRGSRCASIFVNDGVVEAIC
jgi:hypothetical protein